MLVFGGASLVNHNKYVDMVFESKTIFVSVSQRGYLSQTTIWPSENDGQQSKPLGRKMFLHDCIWTIRCSLLFSRLKSYRSLLGLCCSIFELRYQMTDQFGLTKFGNSMTSSTLGGNNSFEPYIGYLYTPMFFCFRAVHHPQTTNKGWEPKQTHKQTNKQRPDDRQRIFSGKIWYNFQKITKLGVCIYKSHVYTSSIWLSCKKWYVASYHPFYQNQSDPLNCPDLCGYHPVSGWLGPVSGWCVVSVSIFALDLYCGRHSCTGIMVGATKVSVFLVLPSSQGHMICEFGTSELIYLNKKKIYIYRLT